MIPARKVAKMAGVSWSVANEWITHPTAFGFPTPVGYDETGVLFDPEEVGEFIARQEAYAAWWGRWERARA